MLKSPKVSIALATYNGEDYLAEQLDSLLIQDYQNLEIVISDDCSSDGTWDILEKYAKNNNKIRLLPRDFNRGYVKNFARTFSECTGTFISPCDQDDIWHPNKVRRLVESIENFDLAYCNSRFCDALGKSMGSTLGDTIDMASGRDPRKFIFYTSVSGHAMLFRKDLLDNIPSIENVSYIDWFVAFLAANRPGIYYLDEILVEWRQHSSSLTSIFRRNVHGAKAKGLKSDLQNLEAFSTVKGEHQDFVLQTRKKMHAWLNSYLNPTMFFFVLRYGHITHSSHPAKFPSLKYLVGYKLKKLLRPDYY